MAPLLAALTFLGVWLVVQPAITPANDSYRYARATLTVLGASPADAERNALTAACADLARWRAREAALDPVAMETPLISGKRPTSASRNIRTD